MRAAIRIEGRAFAGFALVATVAALLAAGRAAAAVYWSSARDGIGAADLDGSNPINDYMYAEADPSQAAGPACGVVIGTEDLYWAAPDSIVRRKLVEGEGLVPGVLVPYVESPCGLTSDGSHLFWASPGGHPPPGPGAGSIGRADLDGSEVTTTLITGLEHPCGLAAAGGHVFWIEGGSVLSPAGIDRADDDGTDVQRAFIPGGNMGCGIAAAGGYLYWDQSGAIARANLEGGELDPDFIPDTGSVEAIAVGAGHIYWASKKQGSGATIGRAAIDGGEADPSWLPTSELGMPGIAVDERATPPALTLPSRSIEPAGPVEYNVRGGAVRFGVDVPPEDPVSPSPPRGELRVTSPGLSWAAFQVSGPHAVDGGAYLWQVRVRSGSGAVGRRIRKQLRIDNEAKVNVKLSYTAPRTYTVEEERSLTIYRYPGQAAGWIKHPHPPKPTKKPAKKKSAHR